MSGLLEKKKFDKIRLDDPFFNSLKEDYPGFDVWFNKKKDEEAYITYENGEIQGFLYLKREKGLLDDVTPVIEGEVILKIGTFKINPHGTRLGERFIKKALDYALSIKAELCYVTIFEKHTALVLLLERYGFSRQGSKPSNNELVLVKNMKILTGDILDDYPLINTKGNGKFLLSIYPQYHTNMFPDSILHTENLNILEDVSYTNSIHKVYVCRMKGVSEAARGDVFAIYRTKTEGQNAEYTSVVSSICVVEEIRKQTSFTDFEQFFNYATTYSIFDRKDLQYWYEKGGCFTIKMTYNAALSKRLIRKKLIEEIGLDRNAYPGFVRLTDEQFNRILKEGEVLEGIVVD
ncbi:N-acetyltransferase [Paenibacillus sp. CGMCC 1.16610]|uniref:N-acetyltransferase n=1 Tax=Paenibacillus anseongense TaxID=2682845 RepID=A0ABW9UCD4_9BACL|nr:MULTISPECIES: N-acetyltransferase [Paenibacillus]MBA2943928.1 N-acetyltransferase [Paenibacillus sp. CGMCC 1.16610]MVQ37817.1 N-acetyltransferase [Paenibacillus anseongense]